MEGNVRARLPTSASFGLRQNSRLARKCCRRAVDYRERGTDRASAPRSFPKCRINHGGAKSGFGEVDAAHRATAAPP